MSPFRRWWQGMVMPERMGMLHRIRLGDRMAVELLEAKT